MRKVKVYALMCDEENGGFTTGIGTETKTYTEEEFRQGKHHELIKNIDIIDGCDWSWSFDWIS